MIVQMKDKEEENVENVEADFETAISETGFGKFNFILLLVAIPSGWAALLESISMSYVFPAAQCDLKLTLENKGMLNAVTYIGMICSSFGLGFLSDIFGRKRMLVLGYFLDAFIVMISSLSQNFTTLVVMKFLGGFIINGPYSAHAAYLSEFHAAKYRARVLMIRGLIVTSSNVLAALLAWGILPSGMQLFLFEKLKVHPWNIYLLILAIFSLVSSIMFFFMPESPKFLMSSGRNDKALEVFQLVYRINTGRPKSTYPIKNLVGTSKMMEKDAPGFGIDVPKKRERFAKKAWLQLKPLFSSQYRMKILLLCLVDFGLLMGVYSLKLWLPQIFTAINTYKMQHKGTTTFLCEMMHSMHDNFGGHRLTNVTQKCIAKQTNNFVYINTVIVASTAVLGYLTIAIVINSTGKKVTLFCLSFIAGLCCLSMYFASNTVGVTSLAAIIIAFLNISGSISLAIAVDTFPTTLRALAISSALTIGKIGAMLGNLLFPVLFQSGCLLIFLFYGIWILGCSLLSTQLPNTNLKPLE